MGYYSGGDGFLKVDGTKAATVTTWSFTASQETLDITSLGDLDRKLISRMNKLMKNSKRKWKASLTLPISLPK